MDRRPKTCSRRRRLSHTAPKGAPVRSRATGDTTGALDGFERPRRAATVAVTPAGNRTYTGQVKTTDPKVVVAGDTGLIDSKPSSPQSEELNMLMIAEGTIHNPVTDQERRTAAAWLGPMTDAGFLHGGWIDATGHRLWMLISAADLAEAQQRLDDLPPAQAGSVSFDLTRVEALRTS
jgi:hypothetical protein